MRYAIYYTPPPDHPLTIAGQQWLGRDAFTGARLDQPAPSGISPEMMELHTAFSRRYGFHGTIVAPFEPAESVSEADLLAELREFCQDRDPFDLPRLKPVVMDRFVALAPAESLQALQLFAAAAVEHFSRRRAPLSSEEAKRRRKAPLTPRQNAFLERWGYPYVMEEFRFHMTLAGPLTAELQGRFHEAASRHFEGMLRDPLRFGGLALFRESGPGAEFGVLEYVPIKSRIKRKSA
jgi:putative phosphonate metabolism protein